MDRGLGRLPDHLLPHLLMVVVRAVAEAAMLEVVTVAEVKQAAGLAEEAGAEEV